MGQKVGGMCNKYSGNIQYNLKNKFKQIFFAILVYQIMNVRVILIPTV